MTPRIRLKGFDEPWKRRKLRNYLEVSGEKNAGLRYGVDDVYSVSWTQGVVNQIEFQGRSYAGADLSNYDVIRTDDVVYTKSPLGDEPYGIVKSNKGEPGIVSQLYAVYHPKTQVDPHFVEVYFSEVSRLNEYFRPLVNKGAKNTMNISDETSLGGEVSFPGYEEQCAIAELFSALDQLVDSHQRGLDKLESFKQAMLQKIFPAEDADGPMVRNHEFTEPWKRHTLEELFSESDTRSSELEILSVSMVNGIYPASESDRKNNPGASLANYKVVHEGDIVYNSMRMWQGAVDSSRYEGIVSPAYVVARPRAEADSRFFARLLKQPTLLEKYRRFSQGNSKDTQVLRFEQFAKIEVLIPSLEEQQVIGRFFDELDLLIKSHRQELEKLKSFKQAMLQRMFP